MEYVILPLSIAKNYFSDEELKHRRKNAEGSEVIFHKEEYLSRAPMPLPANDDEEIEMPFPVYTSGSKEFSDLLSSDSWNTKEE